MSEALNVLAFTIDETYTSVPRSRVKGLTWACRFAAGRVHLPTTSASVWVRYWFGQGTHVLEHFRGSPHRSQRCGLHDRSRHENWRVPAGRISAILCTRAYCRGLQNSRKHVFWFHSMRIVYCRYIYILNINPSMYPSLRLPYSRFYDVTSFRVFGVGSFRILWLRVYRALGSGLWCWKGCV